MLSKFFIFCDQPGLSAPYWSLIDQVWPAFMVGEVVNHFPPISMLSACTAARPTGISRHDKGHLQAAKEAAAHEALELRQEVERVMTRHQERVASWEAAAATDEADLHQRGSALEVRLDTSTCTTSTSRVTHLCIQPGL